MALQRVRNFCRRHWRWLLAGFAGFLVFNAAAIEISSQSWFCNSCHIMNSYYASWQRSRHKEVACVSCHIPPGMDNLVLAKLNGAGQLVDDLLSRTSTKPSASVSDISCTRSGCHDLAKVRSTAARNSKYFFDHGKHLDLEYAGIAVHCTTCHSHVQGSEHFSLNTQACITCHLVKPAPQPGRDATVVLASTGSGPAPVGAGRKVATSQCDKCHAPPDKPIDYHGLKVIHAEFISYGAGCDSCHRGVTAPPAKVKDDQCFSCHDFGLERLAETVEQTHRIHTEGRHKVECFSCHGVTRHGPSAQSMRLDQIDCQSCHQGQHAIQQKTYRNDLVLAHQPATQEAVTPMFLAHVDCTGCHIQPRELKSRPDSGARVTVASARSCDNCHKPGLGEQMIPLWQGNTRALYEAVEKMLPADTSALSAESRTKVEEARRLMELVRLDGSWGVHNPRYTQKLLEEARAKLDQAAREGGGQ